MVLDRGIATPIQYCEHCLLSVVNLLLQTPLQNKAEDIHSLFQFLRLAPFEDKSTFMRFIGRPVQNGDPVGTSFLRTVIHMIFAFRAGSHACILHSP
jgi:SNF2 family DNA or RNA helicase